MSELDKGSAVFKNTPDDFIVEEVWEDYMCKVSESSVGLGDEGVDFGKLDCEDRRAFLTCEMEKINIDHLSAMEIIGKKLKNYPHELGYAGTKDKRAWTCQKISIYNANIGNIENFSHPEIKLKNFKWARHKIKIGDLSGNRFRVVLRDADKDAIKILSRVRNTEYLPNYFGEQRFGSLRKDNVKIGKLIFKQRFEEAVFAYLIGFGDKESEEVKKAKKRLKLEKDIIAAGKYFPSELNTENRIIEYLSCNKASRFAKSNLDGCQEPSEGGGKVLDRDWLGALKLIGEKSLLMMCHSVQSQIFNETIERALEEGINIRNETINLVGYNSKNYPERLGRIASEVLRDNGLELKDFNVPQLPSLSLKSSPRKAVFQVRDLCVETEDDELFPPSKKIILMFTLDSGTYATTFLSQFFDLRD